MVLPLLGMIIIVYTEYVCRNYGTNKANSLVTSPNADFFDFGQLAECLLGLFCDPHSVKIILRTDSSWESKGTPPMPPPPPEIRLGKPMVNSPLIRPYFLGGWHWGVPLDSHEFGGIEILQG